MKATEHKETGEKMHIYEVSYLIAPTISEEKVGDEVASIRGILEKSGASIIADGSPEFMGLAYTVERSIESKRQKYNEAYFGWMKFELPVANIANIKSELDKNQSILRHLIIKTVRENTLFSNKITEAEGDSATESGSEGSESSEKKASAKEEMDRSIDALVTN